MDRLAVLEAQNTHSQTRAQLKSTITPAHASTPASGAFPPLPSAMRLSTTTTVQQGLLQQAALPQHSLHQHHPINDAPVTLSALQSKTGGELDSETTISDSVVDLAGLTSVTTSSLPPYKPITQANQLKRLQAGDYSVKPTSENAMQQGVYKDFSLPPDVDSLIETYASDNQSQVSDLVNVIDADANLPELDVASSVLQPDLPGVTEGDGINVVDTVDVLSSNHELYLDTDIDELIGKYT